MNDADNSEGQAGELPSPTESARPESTESLLAQFEEHRARLRRLVDWKLDRRLRGRIDPSDVLQEAHLEIAQRAGEFIDNVQMPAYLWFRFLVEQRLAGLYRKHLGAQMRDVHREAPLPSHNQDQDTATLADCFIGKVTSPSVAMDRAQRHAILQQNLARLNDIDREILLLRHFEEVTNGEAAMVLGITIAAASNRYTRALLRLRELLNEQFAFELTDPH